jgi:hypothetical protein
MSYRNGGVSTTAFVIIVVASTVLGSFIGVFVSRGISPKFVVGDCVQVDRVREDWDTRVDPVKKVARIGKKNYLFADGSDTPFSFQSIYKKVDCK